MKPSVPDRIEKYVQARRHRRAHLLIQGWIKQNRDVDSKIRACEWYRRLGDFTRAYRTISPRDFRLNRESLSKAEARQFLWSAQILNMMGAPGYALEIAKRISGIGHPEELRVIGNLYLSAFEFEKALGYFREADKADIEPLSYAARLGRIATADALFGTGKREEAMAHLLEIPVGPDDELLRAILLQVEGEYLARSEDYRRALPVLRNAVKRFPKGDTSVDYGFALKWLGIALIGCKNSDGVKTVRKAVEVLRRPENRPEMWIDCILWLKRFGKTKTDEEFPLFAYPGLSAGFTRRYTLPDELLLGNRSSAEIWISLPKREWATVSENHCSLPKELELLALVRAAAPYGLSIFRALSLLWPLEVHAFSHLEGRLHKLVERIRRKYGIDVAIRDRNLYLGAKETKRVAVEVRSRNRAPSYLNGRHPVRLQDFCEHYDLGRTQAHAIVKELRERNVIISRREGSKTVLSPTEDRRD